MQRDMSLIREILRFGIDQPSGAIGKNPDIPGYSKEQVSYHVYLMEQAGLVKAKVSKQTGRHTPSTQPLRPFRFKPPLQKGLRFKISYFCCQSLQPLGSNVSAYTSATLEEITWAGHNFFDAAKDDALWKKATDLILKTGASITFDVLLEWLKVRIRQEVGII